MGRNFLTWKGDWKGYFGSMRLTRSWDVFRNGSAYNSKRNSKQARLEEAIK